MTSFTAKVIGKSILLNWHTSTETNNFGFNIEREIFKPQSSVNKWETIGFVFGNGNSNLQRDYSFIDDDPDGFFQIKYRLKQIDIDGEIEYSKVISVKYSLNNFELYQNYPNPFNPSTTISYNIPETGRVVLTLYDILGQSIKKFVNEIKESGTHTINFDAIELNSGTYIYQIEFNGLTQSRKMTLIK